MSDFIMGALQGVRSKLLDLTRRNRLLNYKESAKSIRVVDELPDEVFRILVLEGKSMEFVPLQDDSASAQLSIPGINPLTERKGESVDRQNELPTPSSLVAKKHRDTRLQTPFADVVLERRCKKLLQESRTAIEETGSNLLHLAMGFVEWSESVDSSELTRSPLILVPVKIERTRINRETNCYTYVISYTGEDIETNLSLAEKFNHDFNMVLPTLDEEVLPETYFRDVTETVARRINWRVAREMVLGLFSFSKLLMYRDLDPDRWPEGSRIIDHENITRVLGGRNEPESGNKIYGEEYDIDRDPRAADTRLILDADSSQTSVIIDVVHNKENLVVEGPPGTGKSQTIANLIAAALHQGLSVLFVAEKKAALEVVRSRLDHTGLGDFCLELHSHKTQKGQLHADIGRRIKKTFKDACALDYVINDLTCERDRLIAYSTLVNSHVGPSGETIYDIFWAAERCRTELKGQCPRFCVNKALLLTREQINERINLLQDVARLRLDLSEDAIRAWRDFRPGNILPGDEALVADLFTAIQSQVEQYRHHLKQCVDDVTWPLAFTFDHFRRLRHTHRDVLQEYPGDFLQTLAEHFIDPANIESVEGLGSAIAEHRELLRVADIVSRAVAPEVNSAKVLPIADASSQLESLGYGDRNVRELAALANELREAATILSQLIDAAITVEDFFAAPPIELGQYEQIVDLNRVMDSTPAVIKDKCHPEYMQEETIATFHTAHDTCEALKSNLAAYSQTILFRYLPDRTALADLARNLRSFRGSFFAIFSSQYRAVRRTIKGFLVEPKSFGAPDLVERLECLVDTLTAIDAIRTEQKYSKSLGPLYSGLETDWGKLEESILWGQELAKVVGSQAKAYSLAPRIAQITPIVASAAKKVRDTLRELTPFLASLNLAPDATTGETLSRLMKDQDRLEETTKPILTYPPLISIDITSIASAAQSFLAADHLQASLDDDRYRRLLGSEYRRLETDTSNILNTAQWVGALNERGRLPRELVSWLVSAETRTRRDLLENFLAANEVFWGSAMPLQQVLPVMEKY